MEAKEERKAIWYGMGIGAGAFVFSWLFQIFVSRSGSTHQYGLFSSAMALFYVVGSVVGVGLDSTIFSRGGGLWRSRDFSGLKGLIAAWAVWIGFAAFVLLGVALLHHTWLSALFDLPRDIEVLFLVGWAAVTSSIAMVARGLLLATGHTLLATLFNTLMFRLLTLVAAVIILQFIEPDHTLWAVAAFAVTALILAPTSLLIAWRHLDELRTAPSLFHTVAPSVSRGLMLQLYWLLSQSPGLLFILAARTLHSDLTLIALFSALMQTSQVVIIPYQGLQYFLYTKSDQLIDTRRWMALFPLCLRYAAGMLVFALLIAVLFLFVGDTVLGAFGSAYQGEAVPLAVVVLGYGLLQASQVLSSPLQRAFEIRGLFLCSLSSLLLCIGLGMWSALHHSLAGLVASFFAFGVLQCATQGGLLHRFLHRHHMAESQQEG